MFGSIRGAVATGKAAAKGGSSHPCERPTSIDEQPNLCTISVAADSKDSTRGLALASPIVFFVGDREISRKDMSHVCEKKGVKKPVNPKNHATADNGRRPLLLCERRPPDLLCVQRPVCRHTHAPQESRLSSARAGREKSYILRALPSIFEQLPHGRLAPGRRLLTWKDAGAASLCMDRAAWSRWPRIGWRAARSPSSHLWVASGTMDRVRKLMQAAGHSPASCSSCLLLQARVERRRLE
jgi:hypothetical protein